MSAPALAPPRAGGYQQGDGIGFHDILPSGENGLANPFQLATFEATGARPAHNDGELGMYRDLVFASPGLQPQDLSKYYKDASFGVKPDDVQRTYSPRDDLTIVRDQQFGRAHVYGAPRDDVPVVRDKQSGVALVYGETRAGMMFGAGYVAAEDRLFFIDVLRHLGRAQLSSFVGGSQGNRDFDQSEWQTAPYNEADLQ